MFVVRRWLDMALDIALVAIGVSIATMFVVSALYVTWVFLRAIAHHW